MSPSTTGKQPEDLAETEAMAEAALKAAGR